MPLPKTAAVIGAGVAGMATAARLAAKGVNVTVFETNDQPGGKLGIWEEAGYRFDTGPSLFTQPQVLEALFADCGQVLSNYLNYRRLDEGTRYFYADGTRLTTYTNHRRLAAEIEAILHTDASPTLNLLKNAANAYKHIGHIFLDKPIKDLSTWLHTDTVKALRYTKPEYLLQTMHGYHSQILKHPKLVQLFDRFATYNGSNPYEAPAMLSMIAHLEMNEGTYYAEGGMHAIADALHRLCIALGVRFEFNSPVKRVVHKRGIIEGVEINGDVHVADVVVSNNDVYFTYANLLADGKAATHIARQDRSSSAVIFYWGIAKPFSQLGLHNILFAGNYKAEFDSIFRTKHIHEDPTIYINITAKQETGHAPDGCENWFVMVNTAATDVATDEWTRQLRALVVKKINVMLHTDIARHIAVEKVATPINIAADTGSYMGALYGTASNNKLAAFARHGQTNSRYRNLYFCGGTVHPGGGIPLCLRSGKLAAEAILNQ